MIPLVFALLVAGCISIDPLPKPMELLSSPIITQSQIPENISICFADCDSCQGNGQCETCWTPWYTRNEGGCELSSSDYVVFIFSYSSNQPKKKEDGKISSLLHNGYTMAKPSLAEFVSQILKPWTALSQQWVLLRMELLATNELFQLTNISV